MNCAVSAIGRLRTGVGKRTSLSVRNVLISSLLRRFRIRRTGGSPPPSRIVKGIFTMSDARVFIRTVLRGCLAESKRLHLANEYWIFPDGQWDSVDLSHYETVFYEMLKNIPGWGDKGFGPQEGYELIFRNFYSRYRRKLTPRVIRELSQYGPVSDRDDIIAALAASFEEHVADQIDFTEWQEKILAAMGVPERFLENPDLRSLGTHLGWIRVNDEGAFEMIRFDDDAKKRIRSFLRDVLGSDYDRAVVDGTSIDIDAERWMEAVPVSDIDDRGIPADTIKRLFMS
jgi:hypothetical protein